MKTKKTVIAVLTATLLISAVLITGCIDPQDGIFAEPEETISDYQLPKGGDDQIPVEKGVVRINLSSDTNARTILPDFTEFTDAGNNIAKMYFDVTFTPCDFDGANPDTPVHYPTTGKLSYSAFNDTPFVLTVGYYQVLITAYNNNANDSTTIPIAGWGPSAPNYDGPYEVSAGIVNDVVGDDNADPNLIAFMDGANDGKFEYNITYSALGTAPALTTPFAYTSQQLLITTYPGGTPAGGSPITLSNVGTSNNNTGSLISLPSGYYTVTVRLQASNCQDRVLINAMHIYPGMTSKYTPATIPAPNQNKFTVQFNTNGIAADGADSLYLVDDTGGSGIDYSTRGPNQYPINNAGTVLSPGEPKNDGYNFGGWWTEGSGNGAVSGTEWTIASDLVFSDTVLYAKWTPKAGLQFTITFDISSDAGITQTVNILSGTDLPADPVTLAQIRGGIKSITLQLTGGSFSGIEWFIDGTSIGNTTSVTLARSSAFWDKILADNTISVTGTKDGGYYSANITIRFN